jgi:hypothetical protein
VVSLAVLRAEQVSDSQLLRCDEMAVQLDGQRKVTTIRKSGHDQVERKDVVEGACHFQ